MMRVAPSNRVSLKLASAAAFLSGQSRRQDALVRQQRERQAMATSRRQVAVEPVLPADDQAVVDGGGQLPAIAEIVGQIPDWMVDVPADLSQNWSVVVRPEGQRCIGIASWRFSGENVAADVA